MNTRKLSSSQLKSLARGQLLGKYGAAISVSLVVGAIMLMISLLTSLVLDTSTTAGLVISCLVQLLLEVLSGVFAVGVARFYLNIACEQPYSVADAFSGFREHADRAVAAKFIIIVMELICFLPTILSFVIYMSTESPAIFLISCLLLVASGILNTLIFLTYSQAFFLIVDFPDLSVKTLLFTSRRIMKGNRGRLFYIHVSLLPLYLLGILSCGIALLWIEPYTNSILSNFYLDLMQTDSAKTQAQTFSAYA